MEKEYTKEENKLVESVTHTVETTFTYEEISRNIAALEETIPAYQAERDAQIHSMQESLQQWYDRKAEADRLGVGEVIPVEE